jgi:putative ABC transport system permease protein
VTALALRGLAQRKLRSLLTAFAILLGVAMVAGTFVLTDQITRAFEEIQRDANAGIDVVVRPEQTFGAPSQRGPRLSADLLEEIRATPGVQAAEGELTVNAPLVVRGELVGGGGPPTEFHAVQPAPFDSTELANGRRPERSGELALLSDTARRANLSIGDEIGVATRAGLKEVTLVGTFDLGTSGRSAGGLSIAQAPRADLERWFDARGRLSSIEVTAEERVDSGELATALGNRLGDGVDVRTGAQAAQQAADEINDQISGFLVPALLAFAGAAVLVGAFIIFNTFSITVAQRAREFALLRCLGASRVQILRSVALEALVVGTLASLAGIAAGLAFAAGISALFDAVGARIPRSGLVLEPRTVFISLVVGIGVTLVAAFAPALRATRVTPVQALSDAPVTPTRRRRRWSALVAGSVSLAGLGLLVSGAFGSGAAATRLSTMGAGAALVFIGVALSAKYFVRPLASLLGWPLERAFRTPGRLARENAMRNPGRTAITSAALMVGLALVVYVAVFAASLQSSISGNIDRLVRGDLFVYSESFQPFSPAVVDVADRVAGIDTAAGLVYDQIEVDGRPSNPFYDAMLGVDPAKLPSVYRFEWVQGSDALLSRLGGNRALVEEQFARARDVGVGDTYQVRTPSGGRGSFEVLGIYRDPAVLQGTIVDARALARISNVRDPMFVLADIGAGEDAEGVEARLRDALSEFPIVAVESRAQYKETIEQGLGQLVMLIYALLAVSLVISLFGIANNLFLSIHERVREFGLLRAIGASRSQLRRIVRYESVITAAIGGLLGTVVGVVFAWLVITSLADFGLSFSLPAVQLVLFAVLAVMVGVLGATLPARRGARVDVLDALHHD